MSELSPIGGVVVTETRGIGVRRASVSVGDSGTTNAGVVSRASDSVTLSDHARYLDQLRDQADVRQDLVARVKAEIEAGTYDNDERLDKAIDGLARDLFA